MKKRIIATDFDGTFYVHGQVPEGTRESIERWRMVGNYFGFVTGRGRDFANTLKDIGVDYADFIIVYNGSLICDMQGNVIHEEFIDRETYAALENEMSCYDDVVGFSHVGEELLYHHYYAQFPSSEKALEVAEYINGKYGSKITAFVNGPHVNIGVIGSGKAQGVSRILEHYGFDSGAAAVVGDDFNDLEMIMYHNGWAVENARAEVLAAAPHICKSVGDLADILLNEE